MPYQRAFILESMSKFSMRDGPACLDSGLHYGAALHLFGAKPVNLRLVRCVLQLVIQFLTYSSGIVWRTPCVRGLFVRCAVDPFRGIKDIEIENPHRW